MDLETLLNASSFFSGETDVQDRFQIQALMYPTNFNKDISRIWAKNTNIPGTCKVDVG